ncbi:unnamed protein product [Closterium sp. Yama58-4]|nr:unnamed protein product [Closterium sp. Yama58-4]
MYHLVCLPAMAFSGGNSARRFLLSAFLAVLLFDVAYGGSSCGYCKLNDISCLKQCQCEAPDIKPILCVYDAGGSTLLTCKYLCWPRIVLGLGVSLFTGLIALLVFFILRRNRKRAEEKYAANAPPAAAAYPPPGGYTPAVNV